MNRASERARALAKVGTPTIPVVGGKTVIPDAASMAHLMSVWQVTDGPGVPTSAKPFHLKRSGAQCQRIFPRSV